MTKASEKQLACIKQWKKNNPDKVRTYARKWKERNKDKVAAAARRYAEKYPEKVRARRKKWNRENKEQVREYARAYRQTPQYRFRRYKKDAVERGYVFSLTKEEFVSLLGGSCHYCGFTEKVGVDRKDNNLGYFVKNCVPCCWDCNYLKGSKSYGTFIRIVNRYAAIAEHISKD